MNLDDSIIERNSPIVKLNILFLSEFSFTKTSKYIGLRVNK